MSISPVEAAHDAVDRAAEALLIAVGGTPEPIGEPTGKQPPSTYRLNDEATATLWPAFLAAKQADPFLSLRQYLSEVVIRGVS